MIHKKMNDHEMHAEDQTQSQQKEHNKVMAKIAYKEWKERKAEEARHLRKVEAMEQRRQQQDEHDMRM